MIPPYIITVKRRFVNLWEPHQSQMSLMDIEHALSQIPRWTGHTPLFYSVAEHSMLVAHSLEGHGPFTQIHGLLHDAHEAYIGDISSPLAEILSGEEDNPPIDEMKQRLQSCIISMLGLDKYELSYQQKESIRKADEALWAQEAFHFFSEAARKFVPQRLWGAAGEAQKPITCHKPTEAKNRFRLLYNELSEQVE